MTRVGCYIGAALMAAGAVGVGVGCQDWFLVTVLAVWAVAFVGAGEYQRRGIRTEIESQVYDICATLVSSANDVARADKQRFLIAATSFDDAVKTLKRDLTHQDVTVEITSVQIFSEGEIDDADFQSFLESGGSSR